MNTEMLQGFKWLQPSCVLGHLSLPSCCPSETSLSETDNSKTRLVWDLEIFTVFLQVTTPWQQHYCQKWGVLYTTQITVEANCLLKGRVNVPSCVLCFSKCIKQHSVLNISLYQSPHSQWVGHLTHQASTILDTSPWWGVLFLIEA